MWVLSRWKRAWCRIHRHPIRGLEPAADDLAVLLDRPTPPGIGRSLMEQAIKAAGQRSARTAWVETSNVNVPGIDAYRRLGFSIFGFDLTLYGGTASEGQFAIFYR